MIHRIDAELALGAEVTPIPADLAVDGVDEILEIFTAAPATDAALRIAGQPDHLLRWLWRRVGDHAVPSTVTVTCCDGSMR